MPTGYTVAIGERDDLTFQEFALQCARAFGACVEMRDDPYDKEIPLEFAPSEYHKKQIVACEEKLISLKSVTPGLAETYAETEHEEALRHHIKYIEEKKALRQKYEAMLKQVNSWNPPTSEHDGLKEFMQSQIRESLRFDCSPFTSDSPKKKTGKEWLHEQIEREIKSIAYHTKKYAEEVERVNGRNEWLRALRESLPGGAP